MAEARKVVPPWPWSGPPKASKRKHLSSPEETVREADRSEAGEAKRLEEWKEAGWRDSYEDFEALRQRFTPETVGELLDEAELAALGVQGRGADAIGPSSQLPALPVTAKGDGSVVDGSTPALEPELDSQKFHERIRAAMPADFCGSSGALRVKDLGRAICDIMVLSQGENVVCRPQPKAGKLDLFPLPAPNVTSAPDVPHFSKLALAYGLNSLGGLPVSSGARANPTASRVLKRLDGIVDSSRFLDEELPRQMDFQAFFCDAVG